MLIKTGVGKYKITKNNEHEFACALFNFDIDGSEVKEVAHRQILRLHVYPFLESGGSASILGLASLTGTDDHDLVLSRQRAEAVRLYLTQHDMFETRLFYTGPLRIRQVVGRGNQFAKWAHRPNAPREDEVWRAVWVHAWDKSQPPSDRDIDFGMQLPHLPDSDLIGNVGQALDIASWIISLVATAEIIPVVDMVASIVDTLFSLVVTWSAADQNGYVNGYIQGYDEAMQDMADVYGVPGLRGKPVSQWPPLSHPRPHTSLWSSQPNIGQQKWHEGQQAGCDAAYGQVQQWDRQGLNVEVRGKNVRLSGREVLRVLSLQRHDNVVVYFVQKFNEYLRSKGLRPWPTLLK